MSFDRNELNANARGGSELMAERLIERLPGELTSQFQLVLSRVRELDPTKFRIFWGHDLARDPEAAHFSNKSSIARFHDIVFCSQWQYNQFQLIHDLPYQSNIRVINNGIIPIDLIQKDNETIRLIYTSTPQRGLELLVPVFNALCEHYPNIHLDVFSSFKIYGWDDADKNFEPLYRACNEHPKITYHGFQPNHVVREYMQKAHILAYPSIWEECNSLSVIEAMSAGVMCVHPNFGGLVDGTGNLTVSYPWVPDKNEHANIFAGVLASAIDNVMNEDSQNYLRFVKLYADQRYNIDKIAAIWHGLLASTVSRNPSKEIPDLTSGRYFSYNV